MKCSDSMMFELGSMNLEIRFLDSFFRFESFVIRGLLTKPKIMKISFKNFQFQNNIRSRPRFFDTNLPTKQVSEIWSILSARDFMPRTRYLQMGYFLSCRRCLGLACREFPRQICSDTLAVYKS